MRDIDRQTDRHKDERGESVERELSTDITSAEEKLRDRQTAFRNPYSRASWHEAIRNCFASRTLISGFDRAYHNGEKVSAVSVKS